MQRKGFNETVRTKSQATQKAPVIGRVSQVYEKTDDKTETGNIEVNVQTTSVDHEFRRVPVVATDHAGHAFVPEVDDYVVVDFTKGEGTEPIVVGASPTKNNRAPNAKAGHWRHEWGSEDERLYLEAQPADNSAGTPELIRLAVKSDGLSEAITELTVDTSGSDHTVTVDVGDDEQGIHFDNSDGSFTLLDGGGFGIESDGSGNFTWYMNSVNYDDESGPTTLN